MNPSIISTIFLPLALGIIMFGLGLSLSPADFKRILIYPKAVFIGALTQLVLLPLLGFGIAYFMLSSNPELAVGLIILAMCPGGPTSNLLTHLGNGDTALCITLTAISSIVKIFTIPIMVNIAIAMFMKESQIVQLDVVGTISKIITITILPASLGMLINAKFKSFALGAEKPVKIMSAVFLVLIIVAAVCGFWMAWSKSTSQSSSSSSTTSSSSSSSSSSTIGYFLPKIFNLNSGQQLTISIETSIQNGTLAIAIASSPLMLNNSTMAIPAAVYSIIMFITAGVFISLLNRKKVA